MKIADVKENGLYWGKVNGRVTKVKVTGIYLSYSGAKHLKITNLETGRHTLYRSAAKLIRPVDQDAVQGETK